MISVRQPFCKASDPAKSRFGYKNDPFRKNQSHNSLLQLEKASTTVGKKVKDGVFSGPERVSQFQEIRQRLLERGAGASSQSGSRGASSPYKQKNLAMPVVHENLYVYAADKTERGMALAEKWRLTLVQPSCSSNKDKKPKGERRTSILLGPGKGSPGKSPTDNLLSAQARAEETAQKTTD